MPMQHLFTPDGEAALAAVLRLAPLIAFDFDGTLAPIVDRPDAARVPDEIAARLATLAARLPVAVVTGRAVADVQARLGFAPRFVVGNHGAEDGADAGAAAALAAALDGLRGRLGAKAAALRGAGVTVEDKQLSIALHYRLASDPAQARAAIDAVLAPLRAALRVFGGKMVVNVNAADAPDKAHAVHALAARCGAAAVLFVGDDVNDEPVFETAPPPWLTLRIGCDAGVSAARFCLRETGEMASLLDRCLAAC